jgi:hypothetical protein
MNYYRKVRTADVVFSSNKSIKAIIEWLDRAHDNTIEREAIESVWE